MNFFTRSSKVNEKKLLLSNENWKFFSFECLSGQKCSFFDPANNLSPTYRNFCLKFKMMKDCSFFYKKSLSNRFLDVLNAVLTSCHFFSTHSSKTNFHSMTQCPETTNSVLTLQIFFSSPRGSTGRIHWKLDNPHPRSSVRRRRAGNISWRYDNERKNLIFQFFLNSSSGHLEYTFSWLQ